MSVSALRQTILDLCEEGGQRTGEPTPATYRILDAFNAAFPDEAISDREAGANR